MILQELLALLEDQLSEKIHSLPGTSHKRGAPTGHNRARAFDKVNPKTGARPDRSFLKGYHGTRGTGQGKYFGLEYADEGDFISVIVMRDDVEPTYSSKKKDPNDEYNGINVLFFPDGKIDANTYDVQSKRQWMKDKDKIVAVAKAALKDKDLPGPYDGLMGREVKRGTGKLSFDTDDHVLRADKNMSRHRSDEDGNSKYRESLEESWEDDREKMIARIEGYFGTLESVPYHQINTEDLMTIYLTLVHHEQIKPFKSSTNEAKASYREPEIPPFAVCYSRDGVVHKDDVFMGTREECLTYMKHHKPTKGFEFDLMDIDTGRLVSFKRPAYAGPSK